MLEAHLLTAHSPTQALLEHSAKIPRSRPREQMNVDRRPVSKPRLTLTDLMSARLRRNAQVRRSPESLVPEALHHRTSASPRPAAQSTARHRLPDHRDKVMTQCPEVDAAIPFRYEIADPKTDSFNGQLVNYNDGSVPSNTGQCWNTWQRG